MQHGWATAMSGLTPVIASQMVVVMFGGFLVFAVLAGVLYTVLVRRRENAPKPADDASATQRPLLDLLCEQHQLTADERHFIEQTARAQSLASAALLFVDPGRLEGTGSMGAALQSRLFPSRA